MVAVARPHAYLGAMRYDPHLFLIAPARGNAELWRLGLGIVAIVAAFILLVLPYGHLAERFLPPSAWGPDGNGVAEATTPLGALVNLYAFGLLIVALWLALVGLHGRGIGTLIGPAGPALAQFRRVLWVLAALVTVMMLLPVPDALRPRPHLDTGVWIRFLVPAVLGVLIQVSAEELVFRGYLQSQLAARFSHPAIWMGLPSLLFGLLHYAPTEMGVNAWLVVGWAALFGLAAADLTARTGTLGPAIALHLVNNIGALLIAAPEGIFDGLALNTYPFALSDAALTLRWMPVDLLLLLCSWLAARVALRV